MKLIKSIAAWKAIGLFMLSVLMPMIYMLSAALAKDIVWVVFGGFSYIGIILWLIYFRMID